MQRWSTCKGTRHSHLRTVAKDDIAMIDAKLALKTAAIAQTTESSSGARSYVHGRPQSKAVSPAV